MTQTLERDLQSSVPEPNVFAEFDVRYPQGEAAEKLFHQFGKYALGETFIFPERESLLARGRIQTNPSPLVRMRREVSGEVAEVLVTWVREEDRTLHIGTTECVPYELRVNGVGVPTLHEFAEAQVLTGEDARITPGVQMPGHLRPHTGWFASVVEATRSRIKPDEAESITQVGYWGQTPDSLEPVFEIHGSKNTTVIPICNTGKPTIDVITRPYPHMAHLTLPDPTYITDERIYNADNVITNGYVTPNCYTGPNYGEQAEDPNYLQLSTHEATRTWHHDGRNNPHYRLARAAFLRPSRDFPKGLFIPVQVLATRDHFPHVEAKVPDTYVQSYHPILYGAPGSSEGGGPEWVAVGVGDNRVGAARLLRAA